jgi:hypothetical protein
MVLVPGDQSSKEGDSRWGSFVSQDLGVSQAGGIVDGDVDELPADTSGPPSAVACDAMADELDAAQFFDVNVDEFSGTVSLGSDRRPASDPG